MAEGPILLNARAQIPRSWDALARSSVYGSELLQQRCDVIKFRLFATIVAGVLEATVYNPLVLDYAAKQVALQVIPAAADYWADQLVTETTSGTNESVTYPDRINSLWRIHGRLLSEVQQMEEEFNSWTGRLARKRVSLPEVSDSAVPLVTVNPYTTTPALNATTWGRGTSGLPIPWGWH